MRVHPWVPCALRPGPNGLSGKSRPIYVDKKIIGTAVICWCDWLVSHSPGIRGSRCHTVFTLWFSRGITAGITRWVRYYHDTRGQWLVLPPTTSYFTNYNWQHRNSLAIRYVLQSNSVRWTLTVWHQLTLHNCSTNFSNIIPKHKYRVLTYQVFLQLKKTNVYYIRAKNSKFAHIVFQNWTPSPNFNTVLRTNKVTCFWVLENVMYSLPW